MKKEELEIQDSDVRLAVTAMAERLTREPHGGQKRSWPISEDVLENDWLWPNKRENCAENVVYPAHENHKQPYLELESLRTNNVDRLESQVTFDHGLLMPGSSAVDRDTDSTGNSSSFGDARLTELNRDEHIDTSYETIDEGATAVLEEVCFGAVSASIDHYHIQLI